MKYLAFLLVLTYLTYTAWFSFRLKKTNVFTDNQKLLHYFLIWLIPFIWILIIKSMLESNRGTSNKHSRRDSPFYESGIGIWGDDADSHDGHSHHHHGGD